MIVGFSTSSAWSSVALIDEVGAVLWSGERLAPQAASGACLSLLEECLMEKGIALTDVKCFAADLGPGSFTGVRVGVTLAKTLAYLHGAMASGADSFDLIDPNGVVVLPSKKGEHFIRVPGEPPFRSQEMPTGAFEGYGFGGEDHFPSAKGFAKLVGSLKLIEPERLVPEYLIEPSISVPKRPFGEVRA